MAPCWRDQGPSHFNIPPLAKYPIAQRCASHQCPVTDGMSSCHVAVLQSRLPTRQGLAYLNVMHLNKPRAHAPAALVSGSMVMHNMHDNIGQDLPLCTAAEPTGHSCRLRAACGCYKSEFACCGPPSPAAYEYSCSYWEQRHAASGPASLHCCKANSIVHQTSAAVSWPR